MGRVRVVCFHIQSSEGGSLHLSQLRTHRLAPVSKFNYVLTHTGFMESTNLVPSMVAELDDVLPYLQDDIRIVCAPPMNAH
jgi:hypothetical protein